MTIIGTVILSEARVIQEKEICFLKNRSHKAFLIFRNCSQATNSLLRWLVLRAPQNYDLES